MNPRHPQQHGHFFFDPVDPIYRHHFPGQPVVPGSLIVSAFMTAIGGADAQSKWELRRFRFKRFVSPGRYEYQIESLADGQHRCRLFDGQTVVATGTLIR